MADIQRLGNCGVTEIVELGSTLVGKLSPKQVTERLYDLFTQGDVNGDGEPIVNAEDDYTVNRAFVIFTGAAKGQAKAPYCETLKRFINDEGLGRVFTTPGAKNPNTGATVTVHVWQIDQDALKRWAKRNDPDREDDDSADYQW